MIVWATGAWVVALLLRRLPEIPEEWQLSHLQVLQVADYLFAAVVATGVVLLLSGVAVMWAPGINPKVSGLFGAGVGMCLAGAAGVLIALYRSGESLARWQAVAAAHRWWGYVVMGLLALSVVLVGVGAAYVRRTSPPDEPEDELGSGLRK